MTLLLQAALVVLSLLYVAEWVRSGRAHRPGPGAPTARPGPLDLGTGFATDFLDTLGIGNFATTTAALKFFRLAPDQEIPGTLNVGHTLPVVTEALIYIGIIQVDAWTLLSMIVAAVAGAWLGAGVVARMPRRAIQIGMGLALLGFALVLLAQLRVQLHGDALGLAGPRLVLAIAGNFVLGALMTLGIGLYAPCMILVSLLGMNPVAAFPIMMGSCAFLMPVGSIRFIRANRYSLRAALGLTIGGLPGVLLAAFLVKSLPLDAVRWLVVGVVVYTSLMMLRSARREKSPRPPLEVA
ncbi:MAG: sulfite exporter TauE/SafE family protein [Acidobacteria bacterium]|nr:MAG: sulfite exporter TauE/SafE family protein [Acidobacteriota bacterium]